MPATLHANNCAEPKTARRGSVAGLRFRPAHPAGICRRALHQIHRARGGHLTDTAQAGAALMACYAIAAPAEIRDWR
jgi:hypothetical protein